jgi:hypothetical protein
MPDLIPREVVELLLHCHHPVCISKCILYPVWLNRSHKRVMFTKTSNSRASGYPLLNVTKDGVDGVISLNCLVRWSLILNLLFILLFLINIISPLIDAFFLRWLIVLNLILFFMSQYLILSWWRCLYGR